MVQQTIIPQEYLCAMTNLVELDPSPPNFPHFPVTIMPLLFWQWSKTVTEISLYSYSLDTHWIHTIIWQRAILHALYFPKYQKTEFL